MNDQGRGTRIRRSRLALITASVLALTIGADSMAGTTQSSPPADLPLPGAEARVVIDQATEAVRLDPTDIDALITLGNAWYQHSRETADPSDYGRAGEAFDRALALDPDATEALIGKGTVALARHGFVDALALGERARDLSPRSSRAWGVIGDALVELGQYDDAAQAVQMMVDLRPDLGSYSRVSYHRELRGDLDGAIEAMESAVLAGGPTTENAAYVRVLLGDLWLIAGDVDRADASYSATLAASPGFVPALGGKARVAIARGDLSTAIAMYQDATARVPLPELLVALGETQEAAGQSDAAATTYRLVRDIQGLFAANGVNTDLDLALFEADHGDPMTALGLAEAAYAATPTVRAADALAWTLHRAGRTDEARVRAEEALRLGSVEPGPLFHAGMIAAAQGDEHAARAWLTATIERGTGWSPARATEARATLDSLATTPEATR